MRGHMCDLCEDGCCVCAASVLGMLKMRVCVYAHVWKGFVHARVRVYVYGRLYSVAVCRISLPSVAIGFDGYLVAVGTTSLVFKTRV